MHYSYFDFAHTMGDEERATFLRGAYEQLLGNADDVYLRRVDRVMKFLRESDFYTIPCRHHPFVGGNAWHQLETLAYAYGFHHQPEGLPTPMADAYSQWSRLWQEQNALSVALVCLLHDLCNAHHPRLRYPDRIMKRHGRKSTYILKDHLHFELMLDENLSIVHHQHKDEETLRSKVTREEDFELIWEMPLYQMVRCCDTESCVHRMTEAELKEAISHTAGRTKHKEQGL